jgi:hypothetical protein
MGSSPEEPKPEAFGVSNEELAATPRPFLARHKCALFVFSYVLVVATLLMVLLTVTQSPAGAVFFAIVLTAAASIVLLPVLACAVCGAEALEDRWLCRRFPAYKACQAFRAAWRQWERDGAGAGHSESLTARELPRDPVAFRALMMRRLEHLGWQVDHRARPELEGFDARVSQEGSVLLIRIETGYDPSPASVGRELMTCLEEQGVTHAAVISRGGPSVHLTKYARTRPLVLVTPDQLESLPIPVLEG